MLSLDCRERLGCLGFRIDISAVVERVEIRRSRITFPLTKPPVKEQFEGNS